MPGRERGTLSNTQVKVLKRFEKEALKLPPFPEEWRSRELGIGSGALSMLRKAELIESVRRDTDENGNPVRRHVWRTLPGVTEWVNRYLEPKTWTPCGCSTGIRTVEAGETFSCRNDDCDCRFDRETAMEVVQ